MLFILLSHSYQSIIGIYDKIQMMVLVLLFLLNILLKVKVCILDCRIVLIFLLLILVMEEKKIYTLITTVTLTMAFSNNTCGNVSLSGSLTRNISVEKNEKEFYSVEHIENIGKMVEDLESNISNILDAIYIIKSKEIIDTSRLNPIL